MMEKYGNTLQVGAKAHGPKGSCIIVGVQDSLPETEGGVVATVKYQSGEIENVRGEDLDFPDAES